MAINMQQNVNQKKMVIIHKDIICAIDIHRKATESVYTLQYLYNMLLISLFLKVFSSFNKEFRGIILFFNSGWYGLLK